MRKAKIKTEITKQQAAKQLHKLVDDFIAETEFRETEATFAVRTMDDVLGRFMSFVAFRTNRAVEIEAVLS